MRIGELSRRAGVSTRLLRYYEEQGLLAPARAGNAYREYDHDDVARAEQVALMVRSGLPTRLIKVLLDLEETERRNPADSCPLEVAETLAAELSDLDERIACLQRSRSTIHDYLVRTEHAALVRAGTGVSRPR
jgi:DNA-binding transcriptional MerR regulator